MPIEFIHLRGGHSLLLAGISPRTAQTVCDQQGSPRQLDAVGVCMAHKHRAPRRLVSAQCLYLDKYSIF